jgi:hypothetical protein
VRIILSFFAFIFTPKLLEEEMLPRNATVLVKRVPVSRFERSKSLVQRMKDSQKVPPVHIQTFGITVLKEHLLRQVECKCVWRSADSLLWHHALQLQLDAEEAKALAGTGVGSAIASGVRVDAAAAGTTHTGTLVVLCACICEHASMPLHMEW